MRLTPKLRFHKVGQYYVRLHGKNVYLGTDKTRALIRYEKLMSDRLAADAKLRSGHTSATVEWVSLRYIHSIAPYLHERTVQESRTTLLDFAATVPVSLASDLTPKILADYRDTMAARHLSRTTISKRLGYIKRAVKYAAEQSIIPAHIYTDMLSVSNLRAFRSPAKEPRKRPPVSLADVEAALAVTTPTVRDLLTVQLLSGARPGEILIMRPCDIDMSHDVWIYRPGLHDDGHRHKSCERYLGKRCQEILSRRIREFRLSDQDFLFSPAQSARESGHHSDKRRYRKYFDVCGVRQTLLRACRRAGVAPITPYQLRHTAGTVARELCGLEATQAFLGHQARSTTEIYAERVKNGAVEIAKRWG